MVEYFRLVSEELLLNLKQIKQYVKKHNPTVGIFTEELLRTFLKKYLPRSISVEQGFIIAQNGEISKQCDILIYDSSNFAPFYRINEIVVVPTESVIAVIEVKTTIGKNIFHKSIDYFANIRSITDARTYLFIYNSCKIATIEQYFYTYDHKSQLNKFDHDTYGLLPHEITGINNSYHLKQEMITVERDMFGYVSCFFENEKGTEISAFQIFYLSVYGLVDEYIENKIQNPSPKVNRASYYGQSNLRSIFAVNLFDM